MRLEDVSAQLRPRAPWESVDLGFALVRQHIRLLLVSWGLTVVPLWVVLLVLSKWVPMGLILLIVWWLKPIYDRVPLFILSRALFGAKPKVRDVLKAWPRMLVKNFLGLMLMRFPWLIVSPRFSWARSLLLPVLDLEQQRGRGYNERQKVLLAQAGGTAGWLVFFCALFETFLLFGLLTLAASMMADPMSALQFADQFFVAAFGRGDMPGWLLWSFIVGYLISMTFVELFYVGGGFGLYLNCRTHLEGWDVEIVFRRLAKRLSHAASILIIGALLLCGHATHAAIEKTDTAKSDDPAKQTIERVMKHPDFKVHTHMEDVPEISSSGPNFGRGFSGIEGLGAVLFYSLLALGVGWLIWIIYKNRHLFARLPKQAPAEIEKPRTLMGMDITPGSLPADIVAAARERWQAGDARGALSLLYRGSLAWLVHVANVVVREADTEGDCLRRVGALAESERRDYFSTLTGEWIRTAYAGRKPDGASMETLLQSWPFTGGLRKEAK